MRRALVRDRNGAALDKEMRRKGVTLALLWEEYRAAHPDEVRRYSWFCEQYGCLQEPAAPVDAAQSHAAGEKVFVDFAGDTIDVTDPSDRRGAATMKLFALPPWAGRATSSRRRGRASRSPTGSARTWTCSLSCGGAPKFVVCDNLTADITNPDRYELGLNRSYLEFADHYGVAILPARPRKPRDKAKVEQSVLIAERWILGQAAQSAVPSAPDSTSSRSPNTSATSTSAS